MLTSKLESSASSPVNFDIFSDGGGEVSSTSAAACIIDDKVSKRRYRLVSFLGGATNNESEIFAGLMALAFVRTLNVGDFEGPPVVQWFADSEYVLKSACNYIKSWQTNGWKTANRQPVKNQGLWRAYLDVSNGIKILPSHVRGHSGHPENEECDSASTWVRNKGGDLLGGSELRKQNALSRSVSVQISGNKWTLFDARSVLDALRLSCSTSKDASGKYADELIAMVSEIGNRNADRKSAINHDNVSSTRSSQAESSQSEDYYMIQVLTLLNQAKREAERSKDKSSRLNALSVKLHELIAEFS